MCFKKGSHPHDLSAQLCTETPFKINISSLIPEDDCGGSGKDSILTRMRSISWLLSINVQIFGLISSHIPPRSRNTPRSWNVLFTCRQRGEKGYVQKLAEIQGRVHWPVKAKYWLLLIFKQQLNFCKDQSRENLVHLEGKKNQKGVWMLVAEYCLSRLGGE